LTKESARECEVLVSSNENYWRILDQESSDILEKVLNLFTKVETSELMALQVDCRRDLQKQNETVSHEALEAWKMSNHKIHTKFRNILTGLEAKKEFETLIQSAPSWTLVQDSEVFNTMSVHRHLGKIELSKVSYEIVFHQMYYVCDGTKEGVVKILASDSSTSLPLPWAKTLSLPPECVTPEGQDILKIHGKLSSTEALRLFFVGM
jgi:hypothetical protein